MKRSTTFIWRCVAFAVVFLSFEAHAHKPSDSYLHLDHAGATLDLKWEIALRDLDFVLDLDQNNDRKLTWGELKSRHDELVRYALTHLSVRAQGTAITFAPGALQVEKHSDGTYAVLNFQSTEQHVKAPIDIEYTLLFDVDAQHRGILSFAGTDGARIVLFKTDARTQTLDWNQSSGGNSFGSFVLEGVWHIWKGFDHLLFLFTLLLPAVVRYTHGKWQVAERFAPVVLQVAKVVTSFTVAHSITLALATLGVVRLPATLVETVIALSVVLAAANNLYPIFREKSWLVAFCFGLVHGFGFANVFADLGISGTDVVFPLLAFNLGVEAGQLALVAVFLPTAYLLRYSRTYRLVGVRFAAIAVVIIASAWTFERLLGFKVLPF